MPDRREARGGVESDGPIIDPTKNVLDLVDAESRHRDSLREADNKYHDAMRSWHEKFQSSAREADTRRIDDLASIRVQYETIIENMRSAHTLTSSTLLATQLKEVKVDLSDRTAKLEQFRWESGGKGLGVNAAAGWVLSVIMAGIAVAAMYLK